MSETLAIRRQLTVLLKDGLHLGPLSQINRLASKCDGNVSICREDYVADAKSMLDLLQLNAIHGTMLLVEARGSQAEEIIEGIARLVSGEPWASDAGGKRASPD